MGVDFFKLLSGLALIAAIIWVVSLRAERDSARAEAQKLTIKAEVQEQAILALKNEKKAADAALTEWKAKNAQIERDLARARKAALSAALADDNFSSWADADLPDAVFVDRLLTEAICSQSANLNPAP